MNARKMIIRLISLTLILVISLGSSAMAGWQNDRGRWWYSFDDGSYARNKWIEDDGGWYYFGNDGYMVTGWQMINGAKYYFDINGKMATRWVKTGQYWYHFNKDGNLDTGWYKDGDKWYFFGTDGLMRTGWVKDNNVWYYMDENGAMCKGWQKIYGSWYYFKDGAMCKGPCIIDNESYVFDNYGRLLERKEPVITSIELGTNPYGAPCIFLRIFNLTDYALDRVDFTVRCYDAYGKLIKSYYKSATHEDCFYDGVLLPKEGTPADHYWSLYGYYGIHTVYITVTKYHTADGRTVRIPKSQRTIYTN